MATNITLTPSELIQILNQEAQQNPHQAGAHTAASALLATQLAQTSVQTAPSK